MTEDSTAPSMSLVTPLGHEYWRDRAGNVFWCRLFDAELNVYRGQYRVNGVDLDSFEPLNHNWSRDARRVYCQASRLMADRESFKILNAIYARDRRFIYYLGGKAKGIDRESFEVLDRGEVPSTGRRPDGVEHKGYARDRSSVYFHDMLCGKPRAIRHADPATFEVLDAADSISRDKNSVFWEERRTKGADPASLEVLGGGYYRDRVRVYYAERALPEADRDTFTVVDANHYLARDCFNKYESGMREGDSDGLQSHQAGSGELNRR